MTEEQGGLPSFRGIEVFILASVEYLGMVGMMGKQI